MGITAVMLPEQILLGIGFFSSGLLFFLLVWLILRTGTQGQQQTKLLSANYPHFNAKNQQDATFVIEIGGRIQSMSDSARELFELGPGDFPNIERLVEKVQPVEIFLEICATEGQARFLVNGKKIKAGSYRVPAPVPSMLLVLHTPETEITSSQIPPENHQDTSPDLLALPVLPIAASLNLDETVESILHRAAQLVHMDFIEIKTWDETSLQITNIFRGEVTKGGTHSVKREKTSIFGNYTKKLVSEQKEFAIADTSILNATLFDPTNQSLPSMGSYIGVPLLLNDKLVGTLEAGVLPVNGFEPIASRVLLTFTQAAAAALNNAAAFETQLKKNKQLIDLTRLAQEIGSIRNINTSFSLIVSHLALIFDFEMIGILLYDPQRHILEAQMPFRGLPDNIVDVYKISIKPNSSMEKIIAEQKSISTGDASLDSRWAELGLQDMALAASIRDTILYPLTSAETFLGYIQLSNTHQGQRSVSKNEQQLLEMIAVQIGIIIENALLLKKEQLRSQRVESIHQVNTIVISSAKLDEILQKALEQTGLLFLADAGAIFIVDEVAGVMQAHVPSAFGVPEELIRPLSRINIKPAAFQMSVAGSQISFISGNLSGDRRVLPIYRAIVRKLNLISAIVVPLIVQGKSIGEMMLGSQKGDHFNDEDLKIAGTIAGQLAAAIQTTRYSGETDALLQRRSNYLTAMNRITREINSSANLEDLARIVYDECLLITGAACGTISIFTGNSVEGETLTPQVIHKGHSKMETIPEIAREALNSGETRLVSEFSKTEPPHNDIQSVLFCPICYQGENFGLIELHANQVDCFDEISIEMTRNIGAQTALAAGNILRYQQQQNRSTGFHQRAEMLMNLFDTSRKPGFGADLEKSLESLVRKIQKITAYNQIQISLYTPQTDLLTNIMSMGTEETSFSDKQNQPQTWKNISSLLKKEFRSGSLTILSGTSFPAQTSTEQAINETLGTEKNYRARQAGTTILIPLFDPDQNPLGLISLENPHTSQQPDRATQEILEIFASETAALIATNLNTQKFQNKIQVLEQEVERQKKNFNFSQQSLPVLLQKDLEHTIELSELIQRARHIRASLQVTETISRQIDTNMSLSILGQQILTSFDMSLAIVARETAEGPQIAHITGILPDGTNPATSFGQRNPLRTCMQTGAAMVIENLDEDETWRDTPFLTNLRAKSFFCIPIIINQKPIAAVLAIDTDVMPTLSDEDRQVYNQAGRQISIILQNISLLNETRQRLQEVNLLLDFNRRLNGLNPHEILKSLLDSALRVVNQAHAGFVLMWEQHAEVLVPVAVANYGNDKNLMQISYRSGEGLPGQVFEEKKPRRIDELNFVTDYNLQPENLLKYRQATGGRLPVSSLIMPIMTTGNNWGILVLDNFNTPAAFRTEDEAILLSLCQQVALSLENVHLMQASQERAGQLQALNSVAATLTANLQREELLSTLLDRMASIIPYDTAILWLREENKMVVKDARGFDDNEERKGLSVQVDESVLLNEMTRTGQAIVVNDVRNDPRFTSLNQPRYLDWMGIPLMAKGQVIGVLALEKTEAYFYSNDLMQLSATFASQATVAIDNATLFEESTRRAAELDERSQRLGMLNTFSAELGGSLSSEQVLSLTATQLMTALQIEKALLLLLGDNNHDYLLNILPDEAGKTNTQRELPSSEILNHLREAQSIYAVEDVSQDPSLASLSALLENSVPQERFAKQIGPISAPQELGPTSEAMLILPLSSSKNRYAIVLHSRQIRRFNSTEIELARTICNQATIALENADLYQSTLSTAKRLTILNQMSYAIGTSLKAEDIYRAAHEATTKLMPVEAFVIALLDDKRHDVEGAYMLDMGERIEGLRLPYGQGLSGQVIATGQPILILHPLDSETSAHGAIIIGKQGMPNSILAVPMLSGGKAIGMLSTQSYQFNAYTEDDQQILSTLANQVTVAILNARLLNETQTMAATLEQRVTERTSQLNHEQHNTETLLRVLTEITASLDLDHALTRTLALIKDAIGAEEGTIMLLNSVDHKLHFRAGYTPGGETSSQDNTISGDSLTIQISEQLSDWVVTHRKPILVKDLLQDERWAGTSNTQHYRSALATPLVASDAVIGAILVFHQTSEYFGEEEQEMLNVIGSQVAIAINNAQLYELISEQAKLLGSMLRQQQVEASRQTAILEAVADGILVTDATNQINFVNDSVKHILGVTRVQMEGQALENFAGLFGKATQTWVDTVKQWSTSPAQIPAGETFAEQVNLENGHVALVHLAPVVWHNEFLGTVSIFRDITHEVEVDRLKSEFVATVSHELRTPMTSIRGYVDLLMMGAAGAMTGNQLHFVEIVKNNTERLNILVNDLLDVSKIETGRVMLSLQPVDLLEVAKEEIDTLQQRAAKEGKQILIVLETTQSLPRILADSERIHQILGNIMDNAYNYTPAEGTIRVSLQKDSNHIQVDVSDTGIGIAHEQQERIFERFFRGEDPLVLATPGTGLGLSIVKQLVEMHHGKIWMESSGIPGQGSKFSITLPIPEAEE